MFGPIRKYLLVAALAIGVCRTHAFSLIGPLTSWQTVQLGYQLNSTLPGGPMNIGEEYRWNVPVVYYGFTPDFMNYFGQKGVNEVEKAIKFMNDLPPASQLKIDDYPLTSQRVNQRAQALGMLDLKSFTLSVMMNQVGLIGPNRFVFTLRNRFIGPGPAPTNYFVIQRNFDPVTWQHSAYINGQLWTYSTIIDNATGNSDSFVVTEPVDPLALLGLINAPVASGSLSGGSDLLLFGGYWTGLTRDDVGGIKYMYRNNNYNIENAPANAIGSGGGSGPWGIPGGGTNTGGAFVNLSVRPGIDRIQFQRTDYDSQFGFFPAFTNSYTDNYVTNGTLLTQSLQRPLVAPDILFDAADLQGGDANGTFIRNTWAVSWTDNAAFSGVSGQFGPGVINPGNGGTAFILTYNSVGPTFFNFFAPFLSQVNNAGQSFIWGSFDGSTNEPVVYPINTSIEAVEQQVLGGGGGSGGGDPFGIP